MLEYFGVATGLLYLALEIKQRPAMWVTGFVTSLVYAFVFFFAKLYADMGLQVYYVLISIYGFRLWTGKGPSGKASAPEEASPSGKASAPEEASPTGKSSAPEEAFPSGKTSVPEEAFPSGKASVPEVGGIVYRHASARALLKVVMAIAAICFGLYGLLVAFTDSPVPCGDAFITAAGIVATWMLARRIIEHWYVWIIANAVSVYIYYLRDLYPTMFLYLCYALLAAAGLYTWIKKGTENR
ncbi:MAG: nicotinamide mononucleotide transporter family protein [Tannerellaceae bacterium]|jgi:nicotinamide mononucleotide transporter|nr:nicotinamide mononucleotide transporter family protein [Tannerellaceae bacterium]